MIISDCLFQSGCNVWIDMLGTCVCLCALLTHVLSLEPEEPVLYSVSARFQQACSLNYISSMHPPMHAYMNESIYSLTIFLLLQCTDGYEYDRIREQCRGGIFKKCSDLLMMVINLCLSYILFNSNYSIMGFLPSFLPQILMSAR